VDTAEEEEDGDDDFARMVRLVSSSCCRILIGSCERRWMRRMIDACRLGGEKEDVCIS